MEFKKATMADFDVAFDYIVKLWTYNTYDKEVIRKVYEEVIEDENAFAFFCIKAPCNCFFAVGYRNADTSAVVVVKRVGNNCAKVRVRDVLCGARKLP